MYKGHEMGVQVKEPEGHSRGNSRRVEGVVKSEMPASVSLCSLWRTLRER